VLVDTSNKLLWERGVLMMSNTRREFTEEFKREAVLLQESSGRSLKLTLSALLRDIINWQPGPGLLQHSDRESQYAAHDYRRLLAKHGMPCSMSRKGNCWDNAPWKASLGASRPNSRRTGRS
jgi:transposase InsO family protein